ncbi:hypothetical protein [Allosalinactinospora lopnorensis]|uniref:hypothetical protein n=1 Tax=Allosalinactinospora lopnorensis TaxID=1352348 RepID=UPI000623CEA4|nr:hypothetical protein [Allosalinactinospora lopnorensis]
MRFDPSASRRTAAVGAALACGVLLAGCDSESVDEDSFSLDEWFSFDEWFSTDEWFSFGDGEDGENTEEEAEGEETEEEEAEEEAEGDLFALPDSCAGIGAEEVAGGLAPAGTVVAEDIGEVEDTPDAEQVSCVWSGAGAGQGGGESFALVFTVNADPSARLEVAQVPGEEEMNWEVDVDVDVDNYRTPQADALGGELDYVATVEGSTQSLHLSLPDNFYVSAIAVSSEASQEDLEQVVLQAAERAQQ